MVAEHIERREEALEALRRLTRPGGKVVIHTVARWARVSIASRLMPFRFHHPLKRVLRNTEDKDTFPVVYRMNTKNRLGQLFESQGFREDSFSYLPDCRIFGRYHMMNLLELSIWKISEKAGIGYPESCLLGVYERS